MAINPKLEFYRFKLNHKTEKYKTFRDFAVEELKLRKSVDIETIVQSCFNHFIKSLSTDKAKDNILKKKVSFVKDKTKNIYYESGPTFNGIRNIIYGVINGGPFGRDRIISDNDNENDNSVLGKNKTVLQYYFFLLYIPADHNEGLFMIHSNSREESITNIFRSYITKLFSGNNYNQATAIDFCPKSFQDNFKNNSTIKSISFKSSFIDELHTTDGISKDIQHYDIKIEAIPKNKSIQGESAESFMNKIKNKVFGSLNAKNKKLNEFEKKTIVLQDEMGGEKTFEWNKKDNDFVPVVYLKSRIKKKNSDDTPDFGELKVYCNNLFNDEILPEIRPDLYVTKS